MNLIGERLWLRGIEEKDAELLRTLVNDPEIARFLTGWSFPVSEIQQQEWIKAQARQNDVIRLVIELKETKESIGIIMLTDMDWKNRKACVAMKILNSEKFRKKGYGCESLKTLNKFVFLELGFNRLEANALSYNKASNRTLELSGYKLEGVKRKEVFKNGEYHDQHLYGLLKDEFIEILNKEVSNLK